jgi:hypothetical protein
LVPIVLAVHQIAQGSDAFARSLNQLQQSGIPVPAWLARLPIAGEYLDVWWRTNLSNPEVLVEWLRGVNTENITAWTSTLGGALLQRLLRFLITLIALFLLLRDGAWLADRALATAGHLLGHPGERLVRKIADAVRATVSGMVDGGGRDRERCRDRQCICPDRRAASAAVHGVDDGAGDGAARCVGTDARTGAVIGFRSIPRGSGDGRQTVDADEVIRMIGGAYRLVSIAVEIETEILGRRNRRVSDMLPLRRRLWRRRSRSRTVHLDADTPTSPT